MISVEEALERILAVVKPVAPPADVRLAQALGLYAAQEVLSPIDLPPFDNSAMDGYAVRSAELSKASPHSPVRLHCVARITAGETPNDLSTANTCVRIFTGSPMPAGFDAVVMQEDIAVHGSEVEFSEAVRPLENVRLRGEDIRKGRSLIKAGERVTPSRIAVLAATGESNVPVHVPFEVALMATGNELREPGGTLAGGQIFESNRSTLHALLSEMRLHARLSPLVPDDLDATVEGLRTGFETADVVISTGGVSVGEMDFVKEAFSRLGGTLDFWRIAMRPGKPFVFGRLGEKLFFGLPGNPVSAFVTFLVLVRPALLKLQGANDLKLPTVRGELVDAIHNGGDRRHFVRVQLREGKVSIAGPQKSHMLGSLGEANGLLDVPPGAQWQAGSLVPVLLWQLPN